MSQNTSDETRWIRSGELGANRGTWTSACLIQGRYGICLDTTEDPAAPVAILVFVPEDDFARFRKHWQSAPALIEGFEDAVSRLPAFKMRIGGLKSGN